MPSRQRRTTPSFSDFNMVNVDFSMEDRILINDWLASRTIDIIDTLINVAEAGFKVSLSWSKNDEAFTLSLTDRRPKKRGVKSNVYLLRHKDAEKLVGVATYFWNVTLQGGENYDYSTGSDVDW